MTVKEYNEWHNKLNHARSFVYYIDHALQKSDENAKMQFKVIGWSEELKEFLDKAIACYAEEVRNRVTKKQLAELKPCPFCGSEADTAFNTNFNWQAFCTNDECFMCYITMYGKATEEEAIEAWNRRDKKER